jgi:hypothetical protein
VGDRGEKTRVVHPLSKRSQSRRRKTVHQPGMQWTGRTVNRQAGWQRAGGLDGQRPGRRNGRSEWRGPGRGRDKLDLLALSLCVCPQLRSTDGHEARGARCWPDWGYRRRRHARWQYGGVGGKGETSCTPPVQRRERGTNSKTTTLALAGGQWTGRTVDRQRLDGSGQAG